MNDLLKSSGSLNLLGKRTRITDSSLVFYNFLAYSFPYNSNFMTEF